jgi:hypothetical protein
MNRDFLKLINNKLKFRFFLLINLPAALFSGLRVQSATETECTVSVPYKWFTRNPFRSTYFACLSMAAEMSTGILALANIYKREPKISMLVVNVTGNFYKKATGPVRFTCKDGDLIKKLIEECIQTKEAGTFIATSDGFNQNGEMVAGFTITWSFKSK